jgi:hypothetical protein
MPKGRVNCLSVRRSGWSAVFAGSFVDAGGALTLTVTIRTPSVIGTQAPGTRAPGTRAPWAVP